MREEHITSIKDTRVVEARELASAAGRAQSGKCLLEGEESVQWALEAGVRVEHVFYAGQGGDAVFRLLRERHIPCDQVSEGILKKISDTSYLVPLLGVAVVPQGPVEQMGDFVVVLDRVQDHGNIGTIVRTATAFGIRDIVSTTSALDLYYKKIISASRGRVFNIRVQRYNSGIEALTALKRRGYQIVATSPHARDLQAQVQLEARPVALVVGNETDGISDEIMQQADLVVQIPMSGLVESLNVGVAAGISLYELKFRMIFTMLINYIRATLGREVGATAKLINMAFDVQLKRATNLSSTQVVLLMMLKVDQRMTRSQVGRDTATFGAEQEAMLRPLFEKRYVSNVPDSEESIMLTEEGERALAQLWGIIERAEQEVLAGFSEDEKGQLRNYLKRIQDNCIEITGYRGT